MLTVLPPVFGPVINKVRYPSPSLISIGTTLSLLSNGWRALAKLTIPSSLISGIVACILRANFALAKAKSN